MFTFLFLLTSQYKKLQQVKNLQLTQKLIHVFIIFQYFFVSYYRVIKKFNYSQGVILPNQQLILVIHWKGGYIGQKREAAPERGTAPGPGQYEISRDRIFQNVSAKFSQMQERQPKPTVGPGEYNVVVQKRGGSLLIQERHKKPARETAPGPGAYF
ncbi:SHIPPO 1-like protein [Spironucleus salmonicida]|uniref:SHIPPO 1-like protein n=1 Tax=Spironucleus salmonicida TaxID=348837 RepID=V6LHT7_9EUKA|nr:SHIPPO 1-like protein [Spironucleus salmonicida]|eukprot:EST44135.1 SHIPPO 1-like protein [Spironucleus salmonicida]